jgi:hypothetical protein
MTRARVHRLYNAQRLIREDVAIMADQTDSAPDRFLLGVADWLKGVAKFSENPQLLQPTARELAVADFVAEAYLAAVEAERQS